MAKPRYVDVDFTADAAGNPDGSFVIEAFNYEGKACDSAVDAVARVLGGVKTREYKADAVAKKTVKARPDVKA